MAEQAHNTSRSRKKVNEVPVKTKANGKNVVNAGFLDIAPFELGCLIRGQQRADSFIVRHASSAAKDSRQNGSDPFIAPGDRLIGARSKTRRRRRIKLEAEEN